MKRIPYNDLPVQAYSKISKRQQSYIDEFTFYQVDGGRIEAHYAGEKLSTWDGRGWQ